MLPRNCMKWKVTRLLSDLDGQGEQLSIPGGDGLPFLAGVKLTAVSWTRAFRSETLCPRKGVLHSSSSGRTFGHSRSRSPGLFASSGSPRKVEPGGSSITPCWDAELSTLSARGEHTRDSRGIPVAGPPLHCKVTSNSGAFNSSVGSATDSPRLRVSICSVPVKGHEGLTTSRSKQSPNLIG